MHVTRSISPPDMAEVLCVMVALLSFIVFFSILLLYDSHFRNGIVFDRQTWLYITCYYLHCTCKYINLTKFLLSVHPDKWNEIR